MPLHPVLVVLSLPSLALAARKGLDFGTGGRKPGQPQEGEGGKPRPRSLMSSTEEGTDMSMGKTFPEDVLTKRLLPCNDGSQCRCPDGSEGPCPGVTPCKCMDGSEGPKGGKCMDGTQAGYYYGPPSSGSSTLWVIWLEGGGACDSAADCYEWAAKNNGKKGGSARWVETKQGAPKSWQLTIDPGWNPDFHDAHHVLVPYCTGDVHTGRVSAPNNCSEHACGPDEIDHFGYYFDGHLNFGLIADDIPKHIGAAASMESVLLQGDSAGGRGVFGNCDFLQGKWPSATVKCNPRFGWFVPGNVQEGADPNSPPTKYEQWSKGELTIHEGADIWGMYLHEGCVAAGDLNCGTVHGMYKYIQAPVFAIQDVFDTSILHADNHGVGLDLTTEQGREYTAYIGNCTKTSMKQIVDLHKGDTNYGMFLSSCADHGSNWDRTKIKDFLKTEALGDWFFGRNKVPRNLVDECDHKPPFLPCNPDCTGMPPSEEVDTCQAELVEKCDDAKGQDCLACAQENGRALARAGCTHQEVQTLCFN